MHKGRWHDGRDVAVKVQYPGAGEALMSDLRQIGRLGRTIAPLVPGVDIKPLIEEMQARAVEELDYQLEAEAQRAFAEAFRDDPDIVVPDVVAQGDDVLVTEWLESPATPGQHHPRAAPRRSATTTASCSCGSCSTARGAPACCTPTRTPATSGSCPNDDGSPGRLGDPRLRRRGPARAERGLPEAMGSLIRIAALEDREALLDGLREEGFIKDRIRLDPDLLLDYLSPFVEPTQVERFRFSREWMRAQFQRINNPREPTYTIAMKLNLPPSYLLIHRTWLGGIGVLSQLEAEAPFRAILTEYLPGFADRRDLSQRQVHHVQADEPVRG